MIIKHVSKSCCGGGKAFIFQTQKPVARQHIEVFEKSGYVTLPHYIRSGLFYLQKGGLVATASFGSTKVQVRCSNANAAEMLAAFEQILDSLTGDNSPR